MSPRWTDDELEQLRRWRAEGIAFSEIARRTGKSREACCSQAHRLDLPKVPVNRRVRPPERLTRADDERDLDLLDAIANGARITVAAKTAGVSLGYAQHLVRQYWDGEPA